MGVKLLKRFRKKDKHGSKEDENTSRGLNETPPVSEDISQGSDLRSADISEPVNSNDDIFVVGDTSDITGSDDHPSYLSSTSENRPSLVSGYKELRPTTVPPVRESAYSGPPRYDWIDVESAAAVKVQSIYRRNKVLDDLEKDGKLTASMRNRARSNKSGSQDMVSEDVPSLFRFCGVGFLFGDAMGEDSDALKATRKSESEERKKMKMANEEMKRKWRMRKKSTVNLEEAVEVVENV